MSAQKTLVTYWWDELAAEVVGELVDDVSVEIPTGVDVPDHDWKGLRNRNIASQP